MPIKLVKKEGSVSFKSNGIPMSKYNEQIAAKEAELKEEYGGTIESLEEEKARLDAEVAELVQKIMTMDSEHKEEIEALEQELAQKIDMIVTLDNEIETLRVNVSNLETEVDELETEIEELKEQYGECSGMHVPEDKLHFTGNCANLFSYNNFLWLIEQAGDKITTKDIDSSSCANMFYNSNELTEIPFDINILVDSHAATTYRDILANFCSNCPNLKKYPMVNLKAASEDVTRHKVNLKLNSNAFQYALPEEPFITKDDYVVIASFSYNMFYNSKCIEEPTWLLDMLDYDEARKNNRVYGSPFPVDWSYSYSIKTIPSYPKFWNNETGFYNPYHFMNFNNCCNLKEIVFPRPGSGALTSTPTGFTGKFDYCATLKKIRFDVQEDGTPYTANWKNVTLSITAAKAQDINGSINIASVMKYLDTNKCVTDEESYQRLKNDSEYWVNLRNAIVDSDSPLKGKHAYYSAWNHDAALELIKTLPDTSAYGTNTLRLRGDSGEGTDGGAINTLTSEEIAIAASRGWTISFV